VRGTWKDLRINVNAMASSNLTGRCANIADVATAESIRRYIRKIKVDVQGEILELKRNTNQPHLSSMNAFARDG